MILTVRYLSLDADMVQHKVLSEHIFNVFIYLPYRIYMFHHSANFARIPLTNAGESLVPYCFASSTASLTATLNGISSS